MQVIEKRTLRTANHERDKEWAGSVELPISFRFNELAGEVGEACNVIKKLERERLGLPGSRATIAQLAEELADVVICVDLILMSMKKALPVRRKVITAFDDLSHAGCCLALFNGHFIADGTSYAINVIEMAYSIAAMTGIDLDQAVRDKFNATSEKVGLRTRLVK